MGEQPFCFQSVAQLRNARRHAGLSLAALARRAGVGYQKLWRAEHDIQGGGHLSESELAAVSGALSAAVLQEVNASLAEAPAP